MRLAFFGPGAAHQFGFDAKLLLQKSFQLLAQLVGWRDGDHHLAFLFRGLDRLVPLWRPSGFGSQ